MLRCNTFSRCVLFGFGLSLLLWAGGILWFSWQIPTQQALQTNAEHTDAIVVLTGGSLRLEEGFTLLIENRADRLLVSGVGQDATLEDLLKYNADDQGIGEQVRSRIDDISLGYLADSTNGNADEARHWMRHHNFTSMTLVTANYHMPRSLLEFKRMMPEVTITPAPVAPDEFYPDQWLSDAASRNLVISEYHKYLVVWLGRR